MAKVGGARPGAGRKPGSPNRIKGPTKATLVELAQGFTDEALSTLREVMQPGNPAAARVSAAIALLDRGHGKPREATNDITDAAPSLSVLINSAAPIGEIRVTRTDS